MSQTLRPYQEDIVEAVCDAIDPYGLGYTRVLYTACTGSGKTTTFAELTKRFLARDWKVLILAHRIELINQAYNRVKDHCELDEYGIGCEIADRYCASSNRVVIASIQTVMNAKRLQGFCPNVIISDESHHAGAKSYREFYTRMGVDSGDCIHIGCTATAKRTDKQSLYAIKPDGTPIILWDKKKKTAFPADADTSVFQYHAFEYSVLNAIEDGYLVDLIGHTVQTDTDISKVKTGIDGDYQEGDLARAVDNNRRTLLAISAWKQCAANRPTLVFCASVEHAHHAADLWIQAGYMAAAVDGTTDKAIRHELFRDFKAGSLQVLCNMGIATEGTDLPNCSCIVHLRPTKSWNLYVQMSGRASRVLPGVIDGLDTALGRMEAIAGSSKPNAILLDLVDICERNDLCTAPSILDLPAELDLQGHNITEARKLLNDFEEVRDSVIGECPTTFEELQVRLETVNLLRGSGAKSAENWKTTDRGYRCVRVPVGYQAELIQIGEGQWELAVMTNKGEELLRKAAKQHSSIRALINHATRYTGHVIEEHRNSLPKDTFNRLSEKQRKVLWHAGYRTPAEIDRLTLGYAKVLISQQIERYKSSQA